MRDFMLEASISMEGNAMETSDVYTQVFQSLMPLIQIAIGDIVIRHKIVNVHANHLSKPGFLSVLPPGEIIPWN